MALESTPDLQESFDRNRLHRATKRVLAERCKVVSMRLTDGSTFSWHIGDIDRLLPIYAARPVWQVALQNLMLRQPPPPSRPWRFVIAEDDFTPGNLHRPDNHRKSCAFYVAVFDMGPHYLSSTSFWIPFAYLRSATYKKVSGGASAANAAVVRALTLDCQAHANGIELPIGEKGGPVLV